MQIYDDRHALHRIPELELELPETKSYLEQALSCLSCKVFSPWGSALCAWFDFGKSAHIAKAAQGVDALMAGAEFYTRAMEMERQIPEGIFRLLKFGKFHSGTARNALSAHTHLEGSLRAFQDETFETMAQNLRDIAADVEETYGCTVNLHLADGYPAVLNPDDVYDKVCGIVPVKELAKPFMTAEDFSWYQMHVPGMFFFLGLGDTPALHADTFDFDETLLLKGADFFEKLAEEYPV